MGAPVLDADVAAVRARPAGRMVRLSDGRDVWVRPIVPTDADALRAFDAALCARSRRLRYLGWMPPLNEERAADLATVDFRDHLAIVALGTGPEGPRLVADCRLLAIEGRPGSAEIAIAVADDHQGLGLGSAMIRLMLAAADHRFGEVIAEVRYDNERMMRVLRRLGFQRRRWEFGVVTFAWRPTRERHGWVARALTAGRP